MKIVQLFESGAFCSVNQEEQPSWRSMTRHDVTEVSNTRKLFEGGKACQVVDISIWKYNSKQRTPEVKMNKGREITRSQPQWCWAGKSCRVTAVNVVNTLRHVSWHGCWYLMLSLPVHDTDSILTSVCVHSSENEFSCPLIMLTPQ